MYCLDREMAMPFTFPYRHIITKLTQKVLMKLNNEVYNFPITSTFTISKLAKYR